MVKDLYFSSIVTKSLEPINSDERFFEGYLTVEVKDKQGEITIVDELYKVLPVWMDRGAPISDTHSNRIIGKGINFSKTMYKSAEGTEIPAIKVTGKIHKNYELDNEIWSKIKSGEYKGLSFGGATKANRTPKVMKDGSVAYQLTDLEHYEVAVCKDPAVPLALITDFNPVAKAMADHTEDRDGKMVIKCSKFGCRIDLQKRELESEDERAMRRLEAAVTGAEEMTEAVESHAKGTPHFEDEATADVKPSPKINSSRVHLESDVQPNADEYEQDEYDITHILDNKGKVNLEGISTFEGKVEALMDEGKSRESAEKIVGSFTKKYDDTFEKEYPYFHDGNDDTCAHCGGDLTCLHCGEYHGGGDHHKTPHTNEDMEESMLADAWENHPELTEDDVVEFPHKRKKKTDYSDDESKENRKKLIDRYGKNEFVDRHGKKGRKPVDKDAPTGHDPTQVAHSPDTPREMELEKGKDLSNTGGDTSSMYNQNGAEQRVNSKKAECPHCGKHFKQEENQTFTDVPYDKHKDPSHVLSLNDEELKEYEENASDSKKKAEPNVQQGIAGGEVPPNWQGSGSPYPEDRNKKVIKRRKLIKAESWYDLKDKAFELDMQWKVIDLVKDAMDNKERMSNTRATPQEEDQSFGGQAKRAREFVHSDYQPNREEHDDNLERESKMKPKVDYQDSFGKLDNEQTTRLSEINTKQPSTPPTGKAPKDLKRKALIKIAKRLKEESV